MPLGDSIVRLLNTRVLPRWRLALRKDGYDGDNHMIGGEFLDRSVDALTAALFPFATGAGLATPDAGYQVRGIVRDFIALYRARPIRDNTGGSGFNGSICIYVVARLLAPKLVIESGTWQGHTAWLLAKACPGAKVISFDLEQSHLSHREPGVDYRIGDWNKSDIRGDDAAASLVFFDDHVSQAQRIREAHERGFRTLLLDDDVPAEALFVTGVPPAPTAAMLMSAPEPEASEIEWMHRGRQRRLTCSRDDWRARDLIAEYRRLPDLASASHYRLHNGMSLLRLKD
ncbi:MAG TPA: hypothetical protein VEU47_13770 [Candidatus Cybelea sp.]|nr:hypothetical protein [Candidatus Cybelea sp.]